MKRSRNLKRRELSRLTYRDIREDAEIRNLYSF